MLTCLFCPFMPQIPERKQLTVPKIESPEGYYEEAEPYDTSLNGASPQLGLEVEVGESLTASWRMTADSPDTSGQDQRAHPGVQGARSELPLPQSMARVEHWPQDLCPLVCIRN